MPISHMPDTPASPLIPAISGNDISPRPVSVSAGCKCSGCGTRAQKLWEGAVSESAVCTLCWLTQNIDSATAAHGHLSWMPDAPSSDLQNLQRRALIAQFSGNRVTRKEGKRIWNWMARHTREVEDMWGTSRASEFAAAMRRLPPSKRRLMQDRLEGCVLILPPDVFDDLTLLLPIGCTAETAVLTPCWSTYSRSDLYAKPPHPLD